MTAAGSVDVSSRRLAIQEAVERSGYVSLSDLTEQLRVSAVTIHRDLESMAAAGTIERVRGGARSSSGTRHEIRTDFNLRRLQAGEAKAAIAARALQEVHDGDTIFLDSSTTSLAFALALEQRGLQGLTVVTNSPAIIFQMHAAWAHVVVTPGDLDQSIRAIVGPWTVDFLQSVRLTTAFVSAGGLTTELGLMTTQRDLVGVIRAAFDRSSRHVALIDSSKFDTSALLPAASLSDVDLLITDSGAGEDVIDRYRASGWNIAISPAL